MEAERVLEDLIDEIPDDEGESDEADFLLGKLLSQMQNEKHAPELLEPNENLFNTAMQRLKEQQEIADNCPNPDIKKIYEAEIKRLQFILNDWKRMRIKKLQKHVFYYVRSEHSQTQDEGGISQFEPGNSEHLTKEEKEFGLKYRSLLKSHLQTMNLTRLPETYRRLPTDLYLPPDLEQIVFVKCLTDIPDIVLDEDGEETLSLRKGDVAISRYHPFKQLIADSSVDLL